MTKLEKVGYSQSDDCGYYKCPKCKNTYSGWELLNMKIGAYKHGIWKKAIYKCKCGEEVIM